MAFENGIRFCVGRQYVLDSRKKRMKDSHKLAIVCPLRTNSKRKEVTIPFAFNNVFSIQTVNWIGVR